MVVPDQPTRALVFGPVPSRRLGLSLGLDITIPKTCSLDCIYCQLGRTTHLTATRSPMISAEDIIADLRAACKHLGPADVDYVTLAGSGEPTLNTHMREIIVGVKQVVPYPLAVLTNTTLLHHKQVRKALLLADLVVPSVDAADEELFRRVNRPHPTINFKRMIHSLEEFSHDYQGQLWIEFMVIKGVNDSPAHAERLRQLLEHIRYDKIQLNTPQRPPAELSVKPLDPASLEKIRAVLGPRCEVISAYNRGSKHQTTKSEETLLNTLRRRPLTLEDIANCLGIHPNEAVKLTAMLRQAKLVHVVNHGGVRYFAASKP